MYLEDITPSEHLECRNDFDFYIFGIDQLYSDDLAQMRYPHAEARLLAGEEAEHDGEPEDFPCVVHSTCAWDQDGDTFRFTHTFNYDLDYVEEYVRMA
jgi:hypothetical protein